MAILGAAVQVLGQRPEASVDDVASAAGVSRQTVYAHYPSRHALLTAVLERITEDAVAAMDAARLDEGPATAALLRLLDAGWHTMERFPLLLHAPTVPLNPDEEYDLHEPVLDRLERLVRRGQETGEFDSDLPPAWLLAATVALGHAAGEEIRTGRLTADEVTAALRRSVLRVFGAQQSGADS